MSNFQECFVCKLPFHYGQGRYYGRHVDEWGVYVCKDCEGRNWDGIPPSHHPDLLDRMRERGIQPVTNAQGWIVIPAR